MDKFIKNIIGSFHSKSFYRDVAKNWKGVGFLYLLLLILVISLPFVYTTLSTIKGTVYPYVEKIIDQIPDVKIVDGKISIDKPMPYYINMDGATVGIIDTTGSVSSLEGMPGAYALLTGDKLILREDENEYKTHDLSKTLKEMDNEVVISNDTVWQWYRVAQKWIPIVVYPIIVIGIVLTTLLGRILQALVYSLFGMIIANSLKIKLDYDVLFRLTVVSLTPMIVIGAIFDLVGLYFPLRYFFAFGFGMYYLYFAIKSNKEGDQL